MPDDKSQLGAPSRAKRTSATIYDIARLSAVSPSTVSRALNKPGRISAPTEKRIREVAEALGYQHNPMARALPTGRTHTIALLLSDITNPVYFEVVRGAERVAASSGYILILAESQESADLENVTAQRLLGSVDGLILVSARLNDADIRSIADRKPVMVVNRSVRGIPSIVPDIAPGIDAALARLQDLGHESICFVPGPSTSWMSRYRERTLRRAASARGVELAVLGGKAPTIEGGTSAFDAVRASGATAIFAFNDLMAIGILKAAQASGLDVPEDLSIVGFDDIFGSDFTSPPLTTVRSPLGALGEEAARQLISAVESTDDTTGQKLTTALVERGSTGLRSI